MAYDDVQFVLQTKPQDGFVWVIIAAGVTAVVLALGLFIFASNVAYREANHGWYFFAFFITAGLLGATIGMRNVGAAIFMGVAITLILGIGIAKFNWRQEMLARVNDPSTPTLLGDYVRDLPTLETNLNPYATGPNWVAFDKDCFQPALTGKGVAAECKDKNMISQKYRIDVRGLITQRFMVMKQTALRISKSELLTKAEYQACVNNGSCAAVPMLPATIDPSTLSINTPDYKEFRTAFWDLIDNETMKLSACDYISLCKAMTITGAISRTDFAG